MTSPGGHHPDQGHPIAHVGVPITRWTPSNARETVALSFHRLLVAKDIDAFARIWAEDAIQEIPFPPEIEGFRPVRAGRDEIVPYYRAAMPGRRDHMFWIEDVWSTSDPEVVIVAATAHSHVIASGRDYDQRYLFVYRVRGGKLVLMREHVDPSRFEAAFLDPPSSGNSDPAVGRLAVELLDRDGQEVDDLSLPPGPASLAVRFLAAAAAGDRATLMTLLAPDASMEWPFDARLGLRVGAAAVASSCHGVAEILDKARLRIYAVHETLTPGCIIVEAIIEAGRYRNRQVAVVESDRGAVSRVRLYTNPILQRAMPDGRRPVAQ